MYSGKDFHKLFMKLLAHGTAKYHQKLYSAKNLNSIHGLEQAQLIYLRETVHTLKSAIQHNSKESLFVLDTKSLKRCLASFQKCYTNFKKNKSKLNQSRLNTRKVIWGTLIYSKNFYCYHVKDIHNNMFNNPMYYPKVITNNHRLYYVNNDNKSLVGNTFNCDSMPNAEIKTKWHNMGHKIYPDFSIKDNPMFSTDISAPRVCIINHVAFYYNPKKIPLRAILNANIPFLPHDQDEYDVTDLVDKNGKSVKKYSKDTSVVEY